MQKIPLKFLSDCKISELDIISLGYSIETLYDIYRDFKKKSGEYVELGSYIVQTFLQQKDLFHSIKFRIKDPKKLIEKIVRKGKRGLSVDNYEQEINDLIGIRVLLLDRKDRSKIDSFIQEKWKLREKKAYYCIESDEQEYKKSFENNEIIKKEGGYSSLHYIIQTSPTKKKYFIEIQVRSILEEVWGEVDHLLRYKQVLPKGKAPTVSVGLEILKSLIMEGNELVTLLCKINKDNIYIKDIQRIYQIIERSSLSEEEKKKLYNELNPFGNINKQISEMNNNISSLIKPIIEQHKVIEEFAEKQRIARERYESIFKSILDRKY